MSKNFEEEYKSLAKEDMTDLWDRIEAGLTPRPNDKAVNQDNDMQKESKPVRKISFWHRYKSVLAAAVCVIVVLPAILLFTQKEKSFTESTDESAAAIVTDELFESTVESAPESAETNEQEVRGMAEASLDVASDAAGTGTTQGSMEERQSNKMEAAKASAQLDKVRVKVKAGENIPSEDGGGTLYTVTILEDPTGTLATDTELLLFNPIYSSHMLVETEREYLIQIKYDAQEKYPYSLVLLYNEVEP